MDMAKLKVILDNHKRWLDGKGGERANLSSADLSYADLRSANLRDANLSCANLSGANLSDANLRDANLSSANLSSADLSYADLRSANLSDANLRCADLRCANLRCAGLRGADLRGADLSCADLSTSRLSGATGNMREIKTLLLEVWPVTYTAKHLHIGCERHLIADWWDFDDDRIARMDSKALAWWKKWKAYIQQTIELSPATPTGNKESEAAA